MIAAAFCVLAASLAAAGRPPVSPERLALARDITEVKISPDGRDVAFITDITGALELWTAPSSGGWPTQLSALGQRVSQARWSPGGGQLVFASDFGGDERPDLYMVDAQGGETVNLTVSTRAETSPRFSPDGRAVAYLSDPEQPYLFQLFRLDPASRAPVQLTHETVSVHFPVWSPDGRLIAVTRSGDDQKGELLLVDALNGETRAFDPPVPGGITMAEEFSADGKSLLCRSRNARGFLQLYWLNVGTGRGRFVGEEDWDVDQAAVHPHAGIVFARNEGGSSALYRMGAADGKPEPLVSAAGRIENFDIDRTGSHLAYLWSDSRHAPDAWVMDLKSRVRQPVTRSMAGIRPEQLSRAQMRPYPSFDGRLIHALFLPPATARLGEPPPAVVVVHGGPDWQVYDDFKPLRQALSQAGFAVIAPNYRGSTGYGREFLELNRRDWGGNDRRDLIEAVRFFAKRGSIDPARVGITGGSYGGYMTLLALAKNKGEWAAGAEAYGMPDLVQDYELTKERFGGWYETQMGTPKTHPKLFYERSAINFLDGITVPLMIFQGANDTKVPKAESQLIYDRLKKKGREVDLVVYPDEGHGFTRRANRTDYYKRLVDFFTRRLK